jgi:uncharacterized protein (TIGR03435 family)
MLQNQHFAWLLLIATGVASSQTFEVASVRPSKSTSGRFTMNGGPGTSDPGRISYTNIMLKRILLTAYDLPNYRISGPDWLDTLRFDITATVPDGSTKEQFQSMLRNLLATRFQMTVHRESKEMAIYALLVAKNGAKVKRDGEVDGKPAEEQLAVMQRAEGKDGFPVLSLQAPGLIVETKSGRGRVTAKDQPMAKFADVLTGQVGRPVFEMTGLGGNYSFVLYFTPESSTAGDGSEPFIFAALQEQLGLRLEARKAPVEMLVIDHIEKVPTEN